jgi:hypothetical protein
MSECVEDDWHRCRRRSSPDRLFEQGFGKNEAARHRSGQTISMLFAKLSLSPTQAAK